MKKLGLSKNIYLKNLVGDLQPTYSEIVDNKIRQVPHRRFSTGLLFKLGSRKVVEREARMSATKHCKEMVVI